MGLDSCDERDTRTDGFAVVGKSLLHTTSLPLLTLDFADFRHSPLTQDGKSVKVDPAFTMSLFVKEIQDEEAQDSELAKWWDKVIDKLIEKFPGYNLIGQAVGYVPVNGATTYAVVVLLQITSIRRMKTT